MRNILLGLLIAAFVTAACGSGTKGSPSPTRTFPASALISTEEVDGFAEVSFLPNDVPGPYSACGAQADEAWPHASVILAQRVTKNFAEGNFVSEQIFVVPDGFGTMFMTQIRESCVAFGEVEYTLESHPEIGDEALTFRYAMVSANDGKTYAGHAVFVRVDDVVVGVHDTWSADGGLGAELVEDIARRATSKLEKVTAASR